MNILLTGTRHTVAVDLARDFKVAGNKVFSAETQEKPITAYSNAIDKHFVVPPPRLDEEGFVAALIDICQKEKIDLLYPVLEEILYVSKHKDAILEACPGLSIMADDFDKLVALHNKRTFYEMVTKLGIKTPITREITSQAQLEEYLDADPSKKFVLKPVYSRYAMGTRVMSAADKPQGLDFKDTQWILQDFIPGDLACLYCFAEKGTLKFHIAYHNGFRPKKGGGFEVVNFLEPLVEDEALVAAAKKIIEAYNFSGNISFDFIHAEKGFSDAAVAKSEAPVSEETGVPGDEKNASLVGRTASDSEKKDGSGSYYILECNPRITGGFHILRENNMFELMFSQEPVTPETLIKRRYQFLSFANALMFQKYSFEYLKALFTYPDVLFRVGDMRPWYCQLGIIKLAVEDAKRYGITADEGAVYDIAWMG